MLICPKLDTGFAEAHHFLVRGETYGHPAVCVCAHLILHICPDAAVTQEVVTRLCIAPRLPISVQTQMNRSTDVVTLRRHRSRATMYGRDYS